MTSCQRFSFLATRLGPNGKQVVREYNGNMSLRKILKALELHGEGVKCEV